MSHHPSHTTHTLAGTDGQHFIDAWMARRIGKPLEDISTEDIAVGIPRPTPLSYDPRTASELGGRLADHLDHLEEDQVRTLLEAAEGLLADIPAGSHEVVAGDARGGRSSGEALVRSEEPRA
jgi:hypothetical protein